MDFRKVCKRLRLVEKWSNGHSQDKKPKASIKMNEKLIF